jgi:hypothetical protein
MFASILTNTDINPILLFAIFCIVIIAWNLSLHWQIHQTRKKISQMFKGSKASDLEGVIFEQIKRLRQTEKDLRELTEFAEYIEKMALKSTQKIGVVRFNPFRDIGGDQSFSIAFLDAENSGFVLSSLFTREGARIYTKPIEKSGSKYPLTEEEQEAIKIAIKSNSIKPAKKVTRKK